MESDEVATLINPGGRVVDVPADMVEELLAKGFTMAGKESPAAPTVGAEDVQTVAEEEAAPTPEGNTTREATNTTEPTTEAPKKDVLKPDPVTAAKVEQARARRRPVQ